MKKFLDDSKLYKDFKIEELEERLEMEFKWVEGGTDAPTATGDVNWENVAIAAACVIFLLLIL